MSSINFFNEDTSFQLTNTDHYNIWITGIIHSYDFQIEEINYIFCSDEYLLQINKEHLNHDFYTDIITFDNSEQENIIESDIFISVDRISENAEKLNIDFEKELSRVMIHGVLHLLGFNDKTEDEKLEMRKLEDHSIALLTI